MSEMMLHNDWFWAASISLVSLLGLWVPLWKGMGLFVRARAATKKSDPAERPVGRSPDEDLGERPELPTLAHLLDQVLRESEQDSEGEYPSALLLDASRQYVVNEYETRYAQPMAMYANILPPIGFIGTTVGLMVLFLSMHLANESMHLSALALALSSSILALVGYATLEGLRIHLYGRLVRCLERGT